jgi:hypothetical protein
MRSYTVRDGRWGPKASLRVKVVAATAAEDVFWRFQVAGFSSPVRLETVVSGIKKARLHRNGDIGVDPADAFEADGKAPLQHISQTFDETAYVFCRVTTVENKGEREGADAFDKAVETMRQLASRIQFNTPDPYINTLGGALVVAADGDWDGDT